MLEDTKLIKKEGLSMFFIAKEASDGIFGLPLIICKAKSFIDSIIAPNSAFFNSGLTSGTSSTEADR